MHFREVRFLGPGDPKTRTVPVTVSTDAPVDRGEYVEILDHALGAVDLSRAPLPLLESHNALSLNIGIVEQLQTEGGRLRGVARFGQSERGEEVYKDVLAGVVRGVSIGYELLDKGKPVEHPSGRALKFKFRPLEVSAVAIPADTKAGFFRSEYTNMQPQAQERDPSLPSRGERRQQQFEQASQVDAERERVNAINFLASRHNLRQLGDKHIRDGTSIEEFRGFVLDQLNSGERSRPLYQPAAEIGLSEGEARNFSVSKFLLSLVDRDPSIAPFEHECSRAVRQQFERLGIRSAHRRGSLLPYEVFRQPLPGTRIDQGRLMIGDTVVMSTRDLSTSSTAAGGAMVATDLLAGDFIDLLRSRTMVMRMGARKLGGLVGNVAIPRQNSSVTLGWVAQAAAATESDAVFSTVTLTPKTIHGIQDVTRDLLLQGTPSVEGLVRADLLATMAVQVDYAALHGTGASNQPTGLAATAGIGSVVGGTNGLAPSWDHVVELEAACANANVFDGGMGYLTNSKVRSKLKRTQKFAGTNGQEIWERALNGDDPALLGVLNGMRAGVSNNVRSDLTKGSSSGVCSAIFFGAWPDLLIGEWGTAEVLVDEVTQAANRIVRMHVYQTVDIAVRRSSSFAAMLDALTV